MLIEPHYGLSIESERLYGRKLLVVFEGIKIPLGVGIVGACVDSSSTINIPNAYEDDRFNPDVDKKTGYHTRSNLCVPACNTRGAVVGALQVFNKVNPKGGDSFVEFSAHDQLTLQDYAVTIAREIETSIDAMAKEKFGSKKADIGGMSLPELTQMVKEMDAPLKNSSCAILSKAVHPLRHRITKALHFAGQIS